MTRPIDREKLVGYLENFPFEYKGGGIFRKRHVPKGHKAGIIHGEDLLKMLIGKLNSGEFDCETVGSEITQDSLDEFKDWLNKRTNGKGWTSFKWQIERANSNIENVKNLSPENYIKSFINDPVHTGTDAMWDEVDNAWQNYLITKPNKPVKST